MAKWNYQRCLQECMVTINTYHTLVKNKKHWDYWAFQEVRDDLSEALLYFGPVLAELREKAEEAEWQRKLQYERRKQHWKEEYKGQRGTASLVESKALLDCETHIKTEVAARKEFQKGRALVERVDQVINSVAGRCKGLLKDFET